MALFIYSLSFDKHILCVKTSADLLGIPNERGQNTALWEATDPREGRPKIAIPIPGLGDKSYCPELWLLLSPPNSGFYYPDQGLSPQLLSFWFIHQIHKYLLGSGRVGVPFHTQCNEAYEDALFPQLAF